MHRADLTFFRRVGGGQLLKRGSKEGRVNSYSLLYYTHLLTQLSVKHSTPTLNKGLTYLILGARGYATSGNFDCNWCILN